jgi:sterol desaturase/sphingolipid hydroxylase (fatty acid hydroxylase superfamily)
MKWYDFIIVFIIIYMISSIVEYSVHKYVMHTPFPSLNFIYESHIYHHKNAALNTNLTLEEDDDNLCVPIDKSIYMYTITLILSYLALLFYPKKIPFIYISVCVLIILLFAVLIWNTYHPIIHGLDGQKVCGIYSIPSDKINKDSQYTKFIINNHKAHHYYKNDEKGNYNITLPFADFVFGNYNVMPKT